MNIPKNAEIRREAWTRLKEHGVLNATYVLFLTTVMVFAVVCGVMFGSGYMGIMVEMQVVEPTGTEIIIMIIVNIICSCFGTLVGIGVVSYFIKIARGDKARFSDVFNGFKRNVFNNIFIPLGYAFVFLPVIVLAIVFPIIMQATGFRNSIVGNVLSFVVFVAFFVYYIVALIKYAFVFHIAGDMSNAQTHTLTTMFRLCKKITRGNKGRIFRMCLKFCLYGFCLWLLFLIGTILVTTVGNAVDVDAVKIILAVALYIAYLLGCVVLGVYTNVCFALLYVKLIDNYYGVGVKNTELDIDQLIAMYDKPVKTEEQQEIQ